MCGIVGLYLKNQALRPELGVLFQPMLVEMKSRGPDSAGVAIYRDPVAANQVKYSLAHDQADYDWQQLSAALDNDCQCSSSIQQIDSHAILVCDAPEQCVRDWLKSNQPGVRLAGSHPFATGADLCLVHNGSLSNHNRLREQLEKAGLEFQTENDTEVAAAYMTLKIREGLSLRQALEQALIDLDGFYTFCVGTTTGFAVLRDPIACKHAVLAETDDWVAMATEYRAIATLPGSHNANIWEPKPQTIYAWGELE